MTVHVEHDYASDYAGKTVDTVFLSCAPHGEAMVCVLMNAEAESLKYLFNQPEIQTLIDIKAQLKFLFETAEARRNANAPPPPPMTGMAAWLPPAGNTVPVGAPTQLPPPPPTGFSCSRCQTFNEYACANQPDGTYRCFGCRS